MSTVQFRIVAPRKAKQFNYEKVYFPHPTDCMIYIPKLVPNFKFEKIKAEKIVIKNKLETMLVFTSGTNNYILENEYQQIRKQLQA